MKTFSEFILTSFVLSIIAGIGERIAPDNMKKYVTFVASLIILIYLVLPLRSLGSEFLLINDTILKNEDQDFSQSNQYDAILKLSQEKAEDAIQKHLCETFALNGEISVSLLMSVDEIGVITLTHISITLDRSDSLFKNEIQVYSENTFHTNTQVLIAEASDNG